MMGVIESEANHANTDTSDRQFGGAEVRAGMVRATAALIGARGVSATSLTDVLKASGAPRGSIYHHFPGGKRQLVAEAVDWGSEQVLAYQRSCDATTPDGVLSYFIDLWREVVNSSDARAGCPAAALATDPYAQDPIFANVVERVFHAWTNVLTEQLTGTGVEPQEALALATTAVASMEGALILSRAQRNVAPIDTVAAQLTRLTEPRNPYTSTQT